MAITQLEMHESTVKNGAVVGTFTIACAELNVRKTFKFQVMEAESKAVLWKDDKVFLEQKGPINKEMLAEWTEPQKIVLCGFVGLYRLARGELEGMKAGMRMQAPIADEKMLDFLAACR